MSQRLLVPLSHVTPEPVIWLWHRRIPLGGITLLEGDPGDGKSTVMYDLAARVTTGRAMPFDDTSLGPSGVVLLQAEDSVTTTVRPSIETAGGDPSRILVYDRSSFGNQPLSLPKDTDIIKQSIDKVQAKLVVIDPLAAFLGGSSNSEATVRSALSELALIAESKNVAIVIVRHLTKGRTSNSKYRGSGSIGIIGAARSALMVADDQNGSDPYTHVIALNKSNLSDAHSVVYRTCKQMDVTVVEWVEERKKGVDSNLETTGHQFDRSQLEEACYVLYTILAETPNPVPAREVEQKAKDALVSKRTLMRAKKKLNVISERVADKKETKWLWSLPKDQPALSSYKDRSLRETINSLVGKVDNDQIENGTEEKHLEPASEKSVTVDSAPMSPVIEISPQTTGARRWDE